MLLNLLISFAFAQEPEVSTETPKEAEETIIVEAHRDIEVYVAPISYHIHGTDAEFVVPYNMIFNYASNHAKSAKVAVGYNRWEPVTMHGGVKVYNEETIQYAWDNCRYSRDHRKCANMNEHYFVETYVTVDENELTINMVLFNSDMQVLNSSSVSDLTVIRWIRQQELTVIQQQGMMGNTTIIHKPKEELPLKWAIPPRLLSNSVRQVSKLLWTGVKLD